MCSSFARKRLLIMKKTYAAVVHNTSNDQVTMNDDVILFFGLYDECVAWMKCHEGWTDLRYATDEGNGMVILGRLATFVI